MAQVASHEIANVQNPELNSVTSDSDDTLNKQHLSRTDAAVITRGGEGIEGIVGLN